MNVSSFDINSKGIFIVDGFGEVIFFDTGCSSLKGCRINSSSKIRDIFCGSDYLLAISRENLVFGLGDNSQNQLCSNKFRKCSEFTHLGINLKEERNI
jgi:alpha-tubulin suppressor-like RCC1 family protein